MYQFGIDLFGTPGAWEVSVVYSSEDEDDGLRHFCLAHPTRELPFQTSCVK